MGIQVRKKDNNQYSFIGIKDGSNTSCRGGEGIWRYAQYNPGGNWYGMIPLGE